MRLTTPIYLTILLPLIGLAAPNLPKWAVPEAPVRIFTSPCHPAVPSLCLPVPKQFQHLRGAQALDRRGAPVPVTPVIINERLLAVELHLPVPPHPADYKAKSSNWRPAAANCSASLAVYLLPEATPPTATQRAPLALRFREENIVGRPATSLEAERMWTNQPLLPLAGNLAPEYADELEEHFAKVDPLKKGTLMQGDQRQRYRYQLAANLRIPTAGKWQFAVDLGNVGAWFAFVDNQPAGGWVEATPNAQRLSATLPVELTAGLHSLTIMGMLSRDEVASKLWIKGPADASFRPLASGDLVSAYPPDGFVAQRRESDELSGASIRLTSFHYFRPYPQPTAEAQLAAATDSPVRIDGRPAIDHLAHQEYWLPSKPSWRLTTGAADFTLDWQVLASWSNRKYYDVPFQLQPLPLFVPVDGLLEARYSLILPKGVTPKDVQIRCEYFHGDLIADVVDVPLASSPFKRVLPLMVRDQHVTAVRLTPVKRNVPISEPRLIRLLAGSAGEPAFARAGARLRTADALAVLRRLAPHQSLKPTTIKPITTVALLDEWAALGVRLQDDADLLELLKKSADNVDWRHFPIAPGDGGRPLLVRFEQLSRAVADKPDAVVFLTGLNERIAGMDLRDQTALLTWCARFCLERDVLPIFATDPWPHADVDEQAHRSFALMIQELSALAKAPAIDLYAEAKLNGSFAPHLAVNNDLVATIPDAAGLRRIADRIQATVNRHNKSTNGDAP